MDEKALDSITEPDQLLGYALRMHESALIAYAAKIVNDYERARDVVQDTFIKLYQQDVEKVKGGLKSWLYTVCRNRSLDVLRKDRRLVLVEDSQAGLEAEAASPLESAQQREQLGQVQECLKALSENQRQVILLKFQKGLSYKEISEETGLKTGNVGFLLHNGLKKLRQLMLASKI